VKGLEKSLSRRKDFLSTHKAKRKKQIHLGILVPVLSRKGAKVKRPLIIVKRIPKKKKTE